MFKVERVVVEMSNGKSYKTPWGTKSDAYDDPKKFIDKLTKAISEGGEKATGSSFKMDVKGSSMTFPWLNICSIYVQYSRSFLVPLIDLIKGDL